MNVKELKELLQKFPDDMEIVYNCHSDFSPYDSEPETTELVPQSGWYMSPHPTMSTENKSKLRTYLVLV